MKLFKSLLWVKRVHNEARQGLVGLATFLHQMRSSTFNWRLYIYFCLLDPTISQADCYRLGAIHSPDPGRDS